jgi:DNA-binding NarL/FixJ family response regulator
MMIRETAITCANCCTHVEPGVEVAGEAGNIADAKALITLHTPDLLFLDVEMPGGSGFDLLKQLGLAFRGDVHHGVPTLRDPSHPLQCFGLLAETGAAR